MRSGYNYTLRADGQSCTNSSLRQWTRQLSSSRDDVARGGIAVDADDSVYITGSTEGGLDGNVYLGFQDIFLTKYTRSGKKQWIGSESISNTHVSS